MFPYVILFFVLLLIFIIFKYRDIISNYRFVLKRIHLGENELDELLNKKAILLEEICDYINNANDSKASFSIKKITQKNIDTIKLDKELAKSYLELKEYLIVNKAFIPDDDTKNKLERLCNLEIDLEATKSYYNDNCIIFNDLLDRFPYSFVGKRKGYENKNLYSFKKDEFFEILKNDN